MSQKLSLVVLSSEFLGGCSLLKENLACMILEFYLTINGQSKVINIMVLFETGHFTLKSRFLAPVDKNPEIHVSTWLIPWAHQQAGIYSPAHESPRDSLWLHLSSLPPWGGVDIWVSTSILNCLSITHLLCWQQSAPRIASHFQLQTSVILVAIQKVQISSIQHNS